jgi:hypothetical protein
MSLMLNASIRTVRDGVPTERERITATDWPELSAKLEQATLRLSGENPDSIVIKLDRPQ